MDEDTAAATPSHATRAKGDEELTLVFGGLVLGAVASAWSVFFLGMSFPVLYAVGLVALGAVSWYSYSKREKLNEMCCMMIGMFFGGVPAIAFGALYSLQTGDYIWSMIIATLIGYVAGVALGRLGGALGRMEGVMAAPMGGFMGGMMGFMARPFDVQLFAMFFMLVILALFAEMAWVVHKIGKKHDCC